MVISSYVNKCKSRFDQFLFASVNPFYASVFRIGLSLMIIVVFLAENPLVSLTLKHVPVFVSLYQNIFLTKPYLLLCFVLSILFGLGYRTRPVGLILVILLFPLLFFTGFDRSRQVLLFTLLAYSLVKSDIRFGIKRHATEFALGSGPIWPIRLIQIQLSVLYGVNALAKTTHDYLSGEILEGFSIMLPRFLVNLSDGYLHLGTLTIPTYLLALATTITEYILAIGFWFRRLRVPTAVLGVSFHLIIMRIVEIGYLDSASMFLYIAFLLPFDRATVEKGFK